MGQLDKRTQQQDVACLLEEFGQIESINVSELIEQIHPVFAMTFSHLKMKNTDFSFCLLLFSFKLLLGFRTKSLSFVKLITYRRLTVDT